MNSTPTAGKTAHTVDPAAFVDVATLRAWQDALDARGLRATGSPKHEAYIDDLAVRLAEVGVADVWTENVPMRRWTPTAWSLTAGTREFPVVAPVAYSGRTGIGGVEGRLSAQPAAGVIGLVEIGLPPLQAQMFDMLDWDAPVLPAHPDGYDPQEQYQRVWLSQDAMRAELARFQEAGAVGLVLAVDLPEDEIRGGYLLYDGVHRGLPALFVGRQTGQALRAAAGSDVRLVLEADVDQVTTRNVLGLIPGAGDELVVVQSHTDGTNGLEDNGPEAILAMAQYLARVPRDDLPRGVLVLLSTGHFAIEEAWGVAAFLAAHREDLVPRIAATMCLEHLGARPSPAGRSDHVDGREHEFGCCFATPHRAVIDIARAALDEAAVTESRVVRPMLPDTTGNSPDGTTWPGDGGPFWHTAGLPSFNFITGPNYLLNVEAVAEFIDIDALRRQIIAFTRATLTLAATPIDDLRRRLS